MTWDEIKTWLLANGWSRFPAPKVYITPDTASFRAACDHGRVLHIRNGDSGMVIHMMSMKMRVFAQLPNGQLHRIATISPKNVTMQGGMPRGMMLWSHPWSPYYHREYQS